MQSIVSSQKNNSILKVIKIWNGECFLFSEWEINQKILQEINNTTLENSIVAPLGEMAASAARGVFLDR
jgi:hypothetical protein